MQLINSALLLEPIIPITTKIKFICSLNLNAYISLANNEEQKKYKHVLNNETSNSKNPFSSSAALQKHLNFTDYVYFSFYLYPKAFFSTDSKTKLLSFLTAIHSY